MHTVVTLYLPAGQGLTEWAGTADPTHGPLSPQDLRGTAEPRPGQGAAMLGSPGTRALGSPGS